MAMAVRALIPAGFMPSADRPFTLEICPDGFPAQLLSSHASHTMHAGMAMHGDDAAKHDGSDRAARAEHCVFAAVASVAPPPPLAVLLTPLLSEAAPPADSYRSLIELTRYRVQQPRGPPALS